MCLSVCVLVGGWIEEGKGERRRKRKKESYFYQDKFKFWEIDQQMELWRDNTTITTTRNAVWLLLLRRSREVFVLDL